MTSFRGAPARHRRLYEDVADQLREAILTDQFSTGERLPTETDLASQFGVSRAVVRQATLNLEHEGLVAVLVGASGGTFVRESDAMPVLRALENFFRHRQISSEDYLHAKQILEPSVLEYILRFSDRAHQDRLQASIDELAAAIDDGSSDERLLTLSFDFHEILIQEVGNPVLELLLGALVRIGDRVPEFKLIQNQNWGDILAEHRAVLKALTQNDARLFRELMVEHLESVQHIYGRQDAKADAEAAAIPLS